MLMPYYLVAEVKTLLVYSPYKIGRLALFSRFHVVLLQTSLLLNGLFKTLLQVYIFKALNGLSPVCLSDCITIYVPSRKGQRSELDTNRLVIPRCKNGLAMDPSVSPAQLSGTGYHNIFVYHTQLMLSNSTSKPIFLVITLSWCFCLCSLRL